MHLVIIIAFASLLWFTSSKPMNWLRLSESTSMALVVAEIVVLVAVASAVSRRTLALLAKAPDDPNRAQHHHHFWADKIYIAVLLAFLFNLLLTAWPSIARSWIQLHWLYGVGDVVVLGPFVITIVLIWVVQYPADRAIRQMALNPRLISNQPVHAVWGLGQYLLFNIRYQLLTVAVPMLLVIVADDALDQYRREIRRWSGTHWAPDAMMGTFVCVIFLFAPIMLRYIWTTEPVPPGELRSRLERIAERMKLKYRDILIWHSRGMVVNAAVMGLFSRCRYVLISDGLLEAMDDRQIEAVFGHEAGHVRYWHIPYFIVFATLTMLVAGGLIYVLRTSGPDALTLQHIQLIVGVVVVAGWRFAFGWLSHRFEHQADISGAMCLSTEDDTVDPTEGNVTKSAAEQFGSALERVAALNGIPTAERGWRHPSIDERVAFLKGVSDEPRRLQAFMDVIRLVKMVLVGGTLVGLAVGAFIYWDQLIPGSWDLLP